MEKNANGSNCSRCLFGEGTAVVIGLPPAFDLSTSIEDSFLGSLGDRAPHPSTNIRSRVLGKRMQYSRQYKNWVAQCLVKFQEALVIDKSQNGNYLITERGRRLLEQKLPSITLRTLEQFPEYVQAQSDRARNAAKTRALRPL
jgi:hypothetical protein